MTDPQAAALLSKWCTKHRSNSPGQMRRHCCIHCIASALAQAEQRGREEMASEAADKMVEFGLAESCNNVRWLRAQAAQEET